MLIAVDLQPVEPGPVNGGAKWLAVELLNGLHARGHNIACFCRSHASEDLRGHLAAGIDIRPIAPYEDIFVAIADYQADAGRAFDLTFFPFTFVSVKLPGVPAVAVLHDIQFRDMPHNFTAKEIGEREASFQNCIFRADRIITVSNFVKSRILENSRFPASQIDVIYNTVTDRVQDAGGASDIHRRLGLRLNEYFLFPANFWEHKNHRNLLLAYALYCRQVATPAKLVLTGSPAGEVFDELAGLRATLGDRVVFAGFVDTVELAALYRGALALVFPSLYEGFGMPLLEAMQLGAPIAASQDTCIPEIVGEAGLLFDPRKPREIARAMKRLALEPDLRALLRQRATARMVELGSQEAMVDSYERAMLTRPEGPRRYAETLIGYQADGWIGARATVSIGPRPAMQSLEMVFVVPHQHGTDVTFTVESSHEAPPVVRRLRRGSRYRVCETFPPEGGYLNLTCDSTFTPSLLWASDDNRQLALFCQNVLIRSEDREIDMLASYGDERDEDETCPAFAVSQPIYGTGRVAAISVPTGSTTSVCLSVTVQGASSAATSLVCSLVGSADQQPFVMTQEEGAWSAVLPKLRRGTVLAINAVSSSGVDGVSIKLSEATGEIPVRRHAARSIAPPPGYTGPSEPYRSGFSVITPSFNQAQFIGRTLDSVLAQDGICDFHVFDGGSTDDTVSVLASYADRLTFVSKADRGQSDAINQGLVQGRGEYIAWINSDDTYAAGAFAKVAAIFADHPEVDVIYGDAFHTDEHDRVIERYPTEEFSLSRLLDTCFICQPATFFRRTLLERYGLLRTDLQYTMDYELWLRFALGGAVFHRTREHLANSRLHDATKTLGSRTKVHHEMNVMLAKCVGGVPSKWLNAFAHFVLEEEEYALSPKVRGVASKALVRMGDAFWNEPSGSLVAEG